MYFPDDHAVDSPPSLGVEDVTADRPTVYLVLAWLISFLLIEIYNIMLQRFKRKLRRLETALARKPVEHRSDERSSVWEEEKLTEGRRDSDIEGGLLRESNCQCGSCGDHDTVVMPVKVEDLIRQQQEQEGKARDLVQSEQKRDSTPPVNVLA